MKRIMFLGVALMFVISTARLATAQDPTPGPDEEEATFISLTAYDQPIDEAIAELEELGVIPSGGSEIFREPYAYFEGTGNWFTPLASYRPHTHVVMAGELTFTPGDTDENETCTFLMRIIAEGSRTNTYLEAGLITLTSGTGIGTLMVNDVVEGESNAFGAIPAPFLKIDLDEPHHVLVTAFRNTATVYLDGQLKMIVEDLDEHTGTYGISLKGRGDNAKCEGRNIWGWEVDDVVEFGDKCGVVASSTVNLRTGPGTTYDRAGALDSGQTEIIVGQAEGDDGFVWWKLESDTWVRSDIVTAGGQCDNVPEVGP
jgi:hypothetical protein